MAQYSLTIQFDNGGLQALNAAGQLVTLVKSVPDGSPVAWVSFEPMENNTITWTDSYSVYASTTKVESGVQITTQSTQPAEGGNTYTFAGGQFNQGTKGLSPTQYAVRNNDPKFQIAGITMVTSGLYQGAVVNGQSTKSPLNAVGVLYANTATFTPVEKVQVFASYYQNNGLVISRVVDEALLVDLTDQTTQTIHYNDATNQFAPGSL